MKLDSFRNNRKLKTLIITINVILAMVLLFLSFVECSRNAMDVKKMDDYLYVIESDDYSYDLADMALNSNFVFGGCSVVRKGNLMGRNFDWYYQDSAEFVVKTESKKGRYASVGVAALTGISPSDIKEGGYKLLYHFLPFYVVDGINEKGLCVSVNMAPTGDSAVTKTTNPDGETLLTVLVCRYLLDYAESTEEAVRILREKNLQSVIVDGEALELEWMISDRNSSVVVATINNELIVTENQNILTNFYVSLEDYTEHAMGIERYDILEEGYSSVEDEASMRALLNEVIYSRYYEADTKWYSESYGAWTDDDGEVFGLSSDVDKFQKYYDAEKDGFASKTREDGSYWITTHQSVYNLDTCTLTVSSQEDSTTFGFEIVHNKKVISQTATVMIPLCILAVIILFIIMLAMIFENGIPDAKSKIFVVEVNVVILALVSDGCAYWWEQKGLFLTGINISNFFAMIMGELACSVFSVYLTTIIREKKLVSRAYAIVPTAFNGATIIFLFVETLLGNTYAFISGEFVTYPLYSVSVYAACLNFVYLLFVIMRYRKVLGKHDTKSLVAYCIFPLLTVAYELINPEWELAFVGCAVSVFYVYITLQARQVSEMKVRESTLNELSHMDTMTGLKNRLSYVETLDNMGEKNSCGVVFCDLNGLKTVNDSLGHSAGDKYLMDFSALLQQYFDKEYLYRISGDEFVIIVEQVDMSSFTRMVDRLKEETDRTGVASVGYSYGYGERIKQLLNSAETAMYQDKDNYYRKHPEMEKRNIKKI